MLLVLTSVRAITYTSELVSDSHFSFGKSHLAPKRAWLLFPFILFYFSQGWQLATCCGAQLMSSLGVILRNSSPYDPMIIGREDMRDHSTQYNTDLLSDQSNAHYNKSHI